MLSQFYNRSHLVPYGEFVLNHYHRAKYKLLKGGTYGELAGNDKGLIVVASLRLVWKGRLLSLLKMALMLFSLMFWRGTPLLIEKMLLPGLEKGMSLSPELAMILVTTLAEGCELPRMSCIKNDNVGCYFVATVALVAVIRVGTHGEVMIGANIGTTLAMDGTVGAVSGASMSTSSTKVAAELVAAIGAVTEGEVVMVELEGGKRFESRGLDLQLKGYLRAVFLE